MKATLSVIALLMLPSLATAMGCSSGHDQQAMSCAEGTVWDSASQSCLPQTTS